MNIKNYVEKITEEIQARHLNGYQGLLELIIKQIQDYYAVNLSDTTGKLVIGLSGGLDSSVTTLLAIKAVGAENVLSITMPARQDDNISIQNVQILKKRHSLLPENTLTIHIDKCVHEKILAINNNLPMEQRIALPLEKQVLVDKIRIGNLASRTRISILYDLCHAHFGRVLGTGNKTEFMQGYAAKYGTPFSFDFGVLDELYKIDIIKLAKLLEIPDEIMEAVPSTGYFDGQSHEQELGMPLAEQDAYVFLLFEKGTSPDEIILNCPEAKENVRVTLQRHRNAKHKRMLRQEHVTIDRHKKMRSPDPGGEW